MQNVELAFLLKRFAHVNNNLRLSIVLIICFVVVLQPIHVIQYSQATPLSNISSVCKCVVFRMDDIQDYWIRSGQISPMDVFISKHQPLSLGLIMNAIGNDIRVVDKIQNGSSMGLFELGIHGWNHTDYTKLSEEVQKSSLQQANEKMKWLFGNTSDVFIPPEDSFDNSTLDAMSQLGFKILSSGIAKYAPDSIKNIFVDNAKAHDGAQNHKIFQLPGMAYFQYIKDNKMFKRSLHDILENVTSSIDKYGYGVIVLHPQNFMKLDANGNLTDTLDQNEIKDLSNLIDSILSRNIKIVSFSEITGTKPKIYPYSSDSILGKSDNLLLRTPDPIPLNGLGDPQYSISQIYNMYGKYIYEKALELGISPSSAAAVVFVESGGLAFEPNGKMIIRFEACSFYNIWGIDHKKEFSDHFQCNVPNDKFRLSPTDAFHDYHGDQYKEWQVFEFARSLNGEAAMKSISMGLSQVMGFNYYKIGYGSVTEMFNKMSSSIKAQLDAFFLALTYKDNAKARGLSCLDSLKTNNYVGFAGCYNASGQDKQYGSSLQSAADIYKDITKGRRYAT
jgi:peptidoglycan/xylan/chitin deacetylase (PgdA/CDA1 family)